MKTQLYASLEEIKKRIPIEKNIWLENVTNKIGLILIEQLAKRNFFRLTDEKKETINKFEDYLDTVRKGVECKKEYQRGIFDFSLEAVEGDKAYETIALLAKDYTLWNVENIINDLEKMCKSIKNRTINSEILEFYYNLFSTFEEPISKNPEGEPHNIFQYDAQFPIWELTLLTNLSSIIWNIYK